MRWRDAREEPARRLLLLTVERQGANDVLNPHEVASDAGMEPGGDTYEEALDYLLEQDYLEDIPIGKTRRQLFRLTDAGRGWLSVGY